LLLDVIKTCCIAVVDACFPVWWWVSVHCVLCC